MKKDYKEKAMKLEEEISRMGELINYSNEKKDLQINESSLSRVWRHSENHDIAIITANRSVNVNCLKLRDNETEGQEFTEKENHERNKDLQALLLNKGYGITKVKGNYIENFETPQEVVVSENSYMVVNFKDDADFFQNIIKYAKYFCQDAVLLKRKGEDAILYGTNNAEFPGLDNEINLGKFKGGEKSEFMTTVNNRPFQFAESFNVNGRYLISTIAKRIEKNID